MYSVNEKEFGQFLSDVSFIGIEFSSDVLEKFPFLERFTGSST